MKKCPYCSEEIQETALKCRYCGEWLEKRIEDHAPKIDVIAQSPPLASSEATPPPPNENSAVEYPSNEHMSERAHKVFASSVSRRSKWGWGWLLLLVFTNPSYTLFPYENDAIAANLVSVANIFITLSFYFWYRQKLLLNKNPNSNEIWKVSAKAGAVSYVLAIALMFPAYFLRDQYESNKLRVFVTEMARKNKELGALEARIEKAFIPEPANKSDVANNIARVEDLKKLIGQRKELMKEWKKGMENYVARKKEAHLVESVRKITKESETLYETAIASLNSLLDYYKTGNENRYKDYERSAAKWQQDQEKIGQAVKVFVESITY